jgi:polysaccharide export outer membrane protein
MRLFGRAPKLFIALSLVAAVTFGQSNRTQPPKSDPAKPEPAKSATTGSENLGAPIDPKTYVIGAEDVLGITVWREPDFSGAKLVRPDGKITFPHIGDVQASGLTPERLGSQIKQALSDIINDPDVTVAVNQVNSKKYYITGEAGRTGAFPLVVPTTVLEALSNAGGFREFANKKRITILRGKQIFKFNYNEVIQGKKLEQNILLQHGDIINVP